MPVIRDEVILKQIWINLITNFIKRNIFPYLQLREVRMVRTPGFGFVYRVKGKLSLYREMSYVSLEISVK